jgi:hypothetical protein
VTNTVYTVPTPLKALRGSSPTVKRPIYKLGGARFTHHPLYRSAKLLNLETHKIHQTIAATRQTDARKFLASRS